MIMTADFYIGRGENGEWLGGIEKDGFPHLVQQVLSATTEEIFRSDVAILAASRGQGWLIVEAGWPWPWDDSSSTDYTYAFDDGNVWISWCGREWIAAADYHGDEDLPKTAVFPKMARDS